MCQKVSKMWYPVVVQKCQKVVIAQKPYPILEARVKTAFLVFSWFLVKIMEFTTFWCFS